MTPDTDDPNDIWLMPPDDTNDRWHVDGMTVTHDDFPGAQWNFVNRENAEDWAQFQNGIGHYATTHAARAWLAAQPKPTLRKGMKIEATLGCGTVIIGLVTHAPSVWKGDRVYSIAGVGGYYVRPDGMHPEPSDIIDWHEVTP